MCRRLMVLILCWNIPSLGLAGLEDDLIHPDPNDRFASAPATGSLTAENWVLIALWIGAIIWAGHIQKKTNSSLWMALAWCWPILWVLLGKLFS